MSSKNKLDQPFFLQKSIEFFRHLFYNQRYLRQVVSVLCSYKYRKEPVMEEKHKEYLEKLEEFAKKHFQKEFEHAINILNFSPFQLINSYLIYQTLEKQEFDLLVQIPDREIRQQFYVPALVMVALIELFRNYCLYKPEINVNDILMKDGKTFKIIDISGMVVKVQYTRSRGANCHSNLTMDEIKKDYIVTTLDNHKPGKSTQRNFGLYKNLFSQFFHISDDIPPSKFKRKSLIIAEGKIVDKLCEFEIDGKNLKYAFPYAEITRNGTWKTNLDIDPMIYIVNDSYTARDHILNKPDIQIDTVVFIGANKYRKHAPSAINDKNRGCFNNCIFIGSEDIPGLPDIRKWEWTQEETNHFNNVKPPKIETIEVPFPDLSSKLKEFHSFLHEIDSTYTCSISKEFKPYAWRALKTILPDEIDDLIEEFDNIDTFSDIAFESGEKLDEEWDLLKLLFREIIDLIKVENRKYEQLKKSSYHDVIVIPANYILRWTAEIKNMFGTWRIEPAPFNRFQELESSQKILFLGFYGHQQLHCMLEKSNSISMLLYAEEKAAYEKLKRNYESRNYALYQERVEKWADIIDLKYPQDTEQHLSSADEDDFSWAEFEFNEFAGDYTDISSKDRDCTKYEIEFEDGSRHVREGSRSVLKNDHPVLVRHLNIGDTIRDYENCEKEILRGFFPDGSLNQIEKDSQLWKKSLIRFWSDYCNGNVDECHRRLEKNGFKRKRFTLTKWLNMADKEMFPASDIDLRIIKDTIEDPELDVHFDSVMSSKKRNRSLSIQSGRELSDEITRFIQKQKKGKFLCKFSDDQINEIIRKNASLKTIKSISVIGEDDDNHA